MIEIAVSGSCEFEGSEADVVKGLVVNAVCLVGVLDELMDGEGGVVRLDHSVGNLNISMELLVFSFFSVHWGAL